MLKPLVRDPVLYLVLLGAMAFYAMLFWSQGYNSRLELGSGQLLLFLTLVLFYPLLEEVVFRGFVQGALLRYRYCRRTGFGISIANTLTSLLFAGVHLVSHPPLWAAAVFAPSLVLGYFRDRYQTLVPSIILHVVFNLGYFLIAGLPG